MNKLQKFERVNSCETIEELCQCILDFADKKGFIQGRDKKFNALSMAGAAKSFYDIGPKMWVSPNYVTREFGLRQQLLYLKYYKEL